MAIEEVKKIIISHKGEKSFAGTSNLDQSAIVFFMFFPDGYRLYDRMETDPFTGKETYQHTTIYCRIKYKFFTVVTNRRVLVGGTHLGGQFLNLVVKNQEQREMDYKIHVNPAIMLANSGSADSQIVFGSGKSTEYNFRGKKYPTREAAAEAAKKRCVYLDETLSFETGAVWPMEYLVEGIEKPFQAEHETVAVLFD